MAIIDEIGNKIASAGKKTSKAFSDMSQVSKLKDSISAEQSKINQLYAAMGKAYYDRYGTVVKEDPFSSMSSQIQGCLDTITRYEEEIKMVQDTKTCPQCGTECKYNSVFCFSCGFAFPKITEATGAEIKFCSNCGASLIPGSVFCSDCGQSLIQSQATPNVVSEPIVEPISAQEKVCSNCGAELIEDAVFCIECGIPQEAFGAFENKEPEIIVQKPPEVVQTEDTESILQEEPSSVIKRESEEVASENTEEIVEETVVIPEEDSEVASEEEINVITEEEDKEESEPKQVVESEQTFDIKTHYYDYAKTVVVPREQPDKAEELESEEESLDEAPEEAPKEDIEEKTEDKICPNCGVALLDDAVFCIECGTSVG